MYNLGRLADMFKRNNYSADVRKKYDAKLGDIIVELEKEVPLPPSEDPTVLNLLNLGGSEVNLNHNTLSLYLFTM